MDTAELSCITTATPWRQRTAGVQIPAVLAAPIHRLPRPSTDGGRGDGANVKAFVDGVCADYLSDHLADTPPTEAIRELLRADRRGKGPDSAELSAAGIGAMPITRTLRNRGDRHNGFRINCK